VWSLSSKEWEEVSVTKILFFLVLQFGTLLSVSRRKNLLGKRFQAKISKAGLVRVPFCSANLFSLYHSRNRSEWQGPVCLWHEICSPSDWKRAPLSWMILYPKWGTATFSEFAVGQKREESLYRNPRPKSHLFFYPSVIARPQDSVGGSSGYLS